MSSFTYHGPALTDKALIDATAESGAGLTATEFQALSSLLDGQHAYNWAASAPAALFFAFALYLVPTLAQLLVARHFGAGLTTAAGCIAGFTVLFIAGYVRLAVALYLLLATIEVALLSTSFVSEPLVLWTGNVIPTLLGLYLLAWPPRREPAGL